MLRASKLDPSSGYYRALQHLLLTNQHDHIWRILLADYYFRRGKQDLGLVLHEQALCLSPRNRKWLTLCLVVIAKERSVAIYINVDGTHVMQIYARIVSSQTAMLAVTMVDLMTCFTGIRSAGCSGSKENHSEKIKPRSSVRAHALTDM